MTGTAFSVNGINYGTIRACGAEGTVIFYLPTTAEATTGETT